MFSSGLSGVALLLVVLSSALCYQHTKYSTAELLSFEEDFQSRLRALQNPSNCSAARKVVCEFWDNCGYGCQMHQIILCLSVAKATDRTLIMGDKSIGALTSHSWDEVFLPLSNTCTHFDNVTSTTTWTENNKTAHVLIVPPSYLIRSPLQIESLRVSDILGQRLKVIHPSSVAWRVAQYVKYIMRYSPGTQTMLDRALAELEISKGPIVGVHVRRTDKKIEAKPHDLREYMAAVDGFYIRMEKDLHRSVQRRIYLATDEQKVIDEAHANFTQFEILHFKRSVETSWYGQRNDREGLEGIVQDTYILSRMHFLVCTFSSNICRLAYEMKMALSAETAENVKSVDWGYFFRWIQ